MMTVSICREGNHEYLSHRVNGRSISITAKENLNAEIAHLVAHKAAKKIHLLQKPETVRFRFGGKKWKAVPVNEFSLFQRLLRYLNIFSVKPVQGRKELYRLEAAHLPLSRQKKIEKRSIAGHAFLKQSSCSKEEYAKGLREKITYESSLSSFTDISAKAFQKHESFLCLNDGSSLNHMDCRIVLEEGYLKLVLRDSALNQKDGSDQAVQEWERLYKKQYGEKKWHEMISFYALDLSVGLTAEHIYRGNIFATNVEWGDLTDFALRVVNGQALSGKEQAMLEVCPECKNWLSDAEGKVENLSPEQFSILMQLFNPQDESYLTGKKILSPIASNYSIGELKQYKPWLDQQELSQIFPQLIKCSSWASYQELLAHVVVKKHLLRRYSETETRLGVLIPAPPEKQGGPIRYYVVTKCISNGGIFSYVLESACKDPSLPTIKLYRSTTVDAYAVNFADTIVNDLNHLNSPGYLGIRDIDVYEREFFKERTIPLWVGYLELAKNAVAKECREDAKIFLEKAKLDIEKKMAVKIEKRNLVEILKDHDRPLNAVFFPYNSSSHWEFLMNHRRDVLGNLITKYAKWATDYKLEVVRKDASALYDYLSKIQKSIPPNDPLFNQIKGINEDLDFWVLQGGERSLTLEDKNVMEALAEYSSQGLDGLSDWIEYLDGYAQLTHENIESKKSTDLQMTGHSLGGACAAVAMARYIAIDGRMPLPNRSCSNFLFDDPGINQDDNAEFLDYGRKNHELFAQLGVTFHIFRRHEAGDIVPVSGEMGIGSIFFPDEESQLIQWCHVDFAVNRRKKSATDIEVAQSIALHGTRFLEARHGYDYESKRVSPYELGLFHRGSSQFLMPDEMKAFKALKASKWKLGSVIKRVFQERVRQSFSLPLLFFRYSVASHRVKHVFPEGQIDPRGAFCQSLK